MTRFAGKSALVTGSASGIGRATTELLAREGASVLACDINEAQLLQQVQQLTKEGLRVSPYVLDVTDSAACGAAVAAAVASFGRLDILCNIAGTLLTSNFVDITDADWARVMAINVNGLFYLSRAAVPHLLETAGSIVNVASAAGVIGVPYGVAYSASKHAVVGITKALAVELSGSGVRVNAVAPGGVATPMTATYELPTGADVGLLGRLAAPLKSPSQEGINVAQPEEIAAAVAYLLSVEARFATGTILVIDGGQTAV